MKRVLLGLALAAMAACGDNGDSKVDGNTKPIDGGDVDATPPTASFTSFVKDLVLNQTNATGTPKAFTDFSTLADPDGAANDTTAYDSLF